MPIPEPPRPFTLSTAEFVKAAHLISQMPPDTGTEIAFAGRSNAGKSSVINALCNRRKLARTSRTPGRTQQFVIYEFATDCRIVDLPGFGFAKVSKSKRGHWAYEIPRYLENRRSLIGLVLVADSRHALKDQELEILEWCSAADLPTLLLLNKGDKLNQKQMASASRNFNRGSDSSSELITPQLFSATTRRGVDQALLVLGSWFDRQPEGKKKSPG